MYLNYILSKEYAGKKLYSLLKGHFKLSGTMISRLKYAGNITINEVLARTTQLLFEGDRVRIDLYLIDDSTKVIPVNAPIEIIYEDEHMICLNKPAGVCTHPVAKYKTDTLSNHLKYYYVSKGLMTKIRPLSRLDKDTTGVISFAKNEYLQDLFTKRTIKKEYLAIVKGKFENKSGEICAPIKRKTLIEREVSKAGRSALTRYEVIAESEDFSLLKVELITGRTHQIRIHFAHIGHPLVGETLYSDKNENHIINRQSLHAYKITYVHPVFGYEMTLTAAMPIDMIKAMKLCGLF